MDVDLQNEPITIEHPFVSQLTASSEDVDGMVELLQSVKDQIARLRDVERTLRTSIALHSKAETKTSRIQGRRYRIKVVQPDPYWAQAELKEVWLKWDCAKAYLRVATLAPNMREVKKLEAMSGSPEFERWKLKLLSARSESTSPPTITVEK